MTKLIAFAIGLVARLLSLISESYGTWLLSKALHDDDEDWQRPGFFEDLIEFGRHLVQMVAGWICGISDHEGTDGYDYRPGLYAR